jgi:hypothetical protein
MTLLFSPSIRLSPLSPPIESCQCRFDFGTAAPARLRTRGRARCDRNLRMHRCAFAHLGLMSVRPIRLPSRYRWKRHFDHLTPAPLLGWSRPKRRPRLSFGLGDLKRPSLSERPGPFAGQTRFSVALAAMLVERKTGFHRRSYWCERPAGLWRPGPSCRGFPVPEPPESGLA